MVKRADLTGSVDYAYNNRNLLETIAFTPKESLDAQIFKFAWNPLGLNTSVTQPDGVQTANEYDERGRLTAIRTGDKLSMQYEYDDFDMKTKSVTLAGSDKTEESYAYDGAGRLAKWTKDGQVTEYEYDPVYNRVSVTENGTTSGFEYNGLNQLVADDGKNYEYDGNGNLTKITGVDPNPLTANADSGTTVSADADVNLTWDPLNRLTGYKASNSDIKYSYDPLNRMTARNNTNFKYAGLANQFVVQSEPGTDTTYLYDMNGSPLAWYNQNRQYAFLKNAHHDVVGSLGDNGLGDVASYEPFGELNQKSEIRNPKSPLGYQGQFSDPDSGLSHMNNRVYSAETGQFLSPDSFPSVISEPGSLNRYAYTQNDPVNRWDVTGAYGMDVHYADTFAWAKEAAQNVTIGKQKGFNANMVELLAQNIASFDQYHDKEWSLAPNNYDNFGSHMYKNGQGNKLHFQNPITQQVSYSGKWAPEDAEPFGEREASIRANEFVDPNVIRVEATYIPVYEMQSLNNFNTASGANQLIKDPTAIHGEKIITLWLTGGTVKDRMEYAIKKKDPRLFGIAMHEYQDTFAHAGFDLWHGTSHENDWFCESAEYKDYCKGKAVITEKDGKITYDYKYEIINNQLLARDLLMEEGTKYWMTKFMNSQATYYNDAIQGMTKAQALSKKEEKMITPVNRDGKVIEVNGLLNVEEDFDDPKFIDKLGGKFGVFTQQGAGIGGAPYLSQTYINDGLNAIKRQP